MMRRVIRLPERFIRQAAFGPYEGRCLRVPFIVDWPELRLTDDQIFANSMAMLDGQPLPYPNHSMFDIELSWLIPKKED